MDSKMIKLNDTDLMVARSDALILLRGSFSNNGKLTIERIQKLDPFNFKSGEEAKVEILKFEKSY